MDEPSEYDNGVAHRELRVGSGAPVLPSGAKEQMEYTAHPVLRIGGNSSHQHTIMTLREVARLAYLLQRARRFATSVGE